jgi:hypothetical protein
MCRQKCGLKHSGTDPVVGEGVGLYISLLAVLYCFILSKELLLSSNPLTVIELQ